MSSDVVAEPRTPLLPYTRGEILKDTADDYRKLQEAWRLIRHRVAEHGRGSIHNLSGLERSLHVETEDRDLLDDELAPAFSLEELTRLALTHFGGSPENHDVAVTNRLSGALLASTLVMVRPGQTVIGVSARHSHPAVSRAADVAGAKFIDTSGLEQFRAALRANDNVALVVITRLSVTYELLSTDDLSRIVELAQQRNVRILVDDAGGARIGPAVFDQPRLLELGIDVGATGLDKYGTTGPRLGLIGGERELVGRIRSRIFELALEARPMLYPAVVHSLRQYDPERVRELVRTTMEFTEELKKRLRERVVETPVICKLTAEDILQEGMDRAGITVPPIVPYEATACFAMLLLRDHGVLTVHFAGLPPGTSALLIKFLPPEKLASFGGTAKLVDAIDSCLTILGEHYLRHPDEIPRLLFGAQSV
ncbi:MAG: hypothetical protein GEU98_04865 [Pseudonocardiaceae bacterium]|nr:hypothetical protein [Pseudonocardiaceae bacterium]